MSFKLTYTLNGQTFERDVQPSGVFSIRTTRENYRYADELSGTMTFSGEDFDFIMEAGACTQIYVTCYFKRTWNGFFSHTDCSEINLSKRYLEVQPISDDEYRKIRPWMRLEMNIIPPYDGIDSRVPVYTVNQYEIETKTARIKTPYTGPNSENWNGYSVNDWIGGQHPEFGFSYVQDAGRRNSLIHELCRNIPPTYFPGFNNLLTYYPKEPVTWLYIINESEQIPYHASDQDNQILWLDYVGFTRYNSGADLNNFGAISKNIFENPALFTLTEVVNYYSNTGQWEFCDILYTREVWRLKDPPPSGTLWNPQSVAGILSPRAWVYFENENLWARRPFNAIDFAPRIPPQGGNNTSPDFLPSFPQWTIRSCDGTWFTPLFEGFKDGRRVRRQVMNRNRKAQQDYTGQDWYQALYGRVIYDRHFHKPIDIVKKLISFVRDQGATTSLTKDDIQSQFWTEDINPWEGSANIWKDVLLGQNSDIKRPWASEQATKEIFSFDSYLEMICKLTNSAWAINEGKFIIEHISYFERGLSYSPVIPQEKILNPFSITSIANNKGFMRLTQSYRYDKPNMQKFEIFKTEGGEEPKNNNTKIEYLGACINNIPGENTFEITIPTTTDYLYARREGRDEGVSFLSTTWNYLISPALGWDGYINWFMPFFDENNIYAYNTNITMESIARRFYNYGRNQDAALLNGQEWNNLFPAINIIQSLQFPYVEASDNPYNIILSSLGFGVVRAVDYQARGNWLEYELGLSGIELVEPPEVTIDWHVHEQSGLPSSLWTISHKMETVNMMRPVVFDSLGNEIDYNTFSIINQNTVQLGFTRPVTGTAHFISLKIQSWRVHTFVGSSDTWDIQHNLNVANENTAISVVLDSLNNEIIPDSIEYVDNNRIIIKFTQSVSGRVTIADVSFHVDEYQESIVDQNEASLPKGDNKVYGKPFVLMAGQEIIYNSHQLEATLRKVGFSENVTANIIVVEKTKD